MGVQHSAGGERGGCGHGDDADPARGRAAQLDGQPHPASTSAASRPPPSPTRSSSPARCRATGPGPPPPKVSATTELLFLPDKPKGGGSVTRLDNLHGGMLFKNSASSGGFQPLLPYGFYASYDGFLGNNDTTLIQRYADYGLNAMTPLAQYPPVCRRFRLHGRVGHPGTSTTCARAT